VLPPQTEHSFTAEEAEAAARTGTAAGTCQHLGISRHHSAEGMACNRLRARDAAMSA
jgi:hypothetical protein